MRIAKRARRVSRLLLRNSFTDGKLDREKISHMVQTLIAEKPRHFVEALQNYQRLLRREEEKRHAVIESAARLNESLANQIVANLRSRYGEDLTIEFRTNPELLGGLRIQIGDDVWDGSIKNRLQKLQEQI